MYAWHDTETSMTINESWRQYANKSDIRNCFIRPNFLAWYNENKKNLVDILTENIQVLENKLTYLNTLRLKHQTYTDKNIFGGFHVSFSKHWLKNGGRYVKVKTQKNVVWISGKNLPSSLPQCRSVYIKILELYEQIPLLAYLDLLYI